MVVQDFFFVPPSCVNVMWLLFKKSLVEAWRLELFYRLLPLQYAKIAHFKDGS